MSTQDRGTLISATGNPYTSHNMKDKSPLYIFYMATTPSDIFHQQLLAFVSSMSFFYPLVPFFPFTKGLAFSAPSLSTTHMVTRNYSSVDALCFLPVIVIITLTIIDILAVYCLLNFKPSSG